MCVPIFRTKYHFRFCAAATEAQVNGQSVSHGQFHHALLPYNARFDPIMHKIIQQTLQTTGTQMSLAVAKPENYTK